MQEIRTVCTMTIFFQYWMNSPHGCGSGSGVLKGRIRIRSKYPDLDVHLLHILYLLSFSKMCIEIRYIFFPFWGSDPVSHNPDPQPGSSQRKLTLSGSLDHICILHQISRQNYFGLLLKWVFTKYVSLGILCPRRSYKASSWPCTPGVTKMIPKSKLGTLRAFWRTNIGLNICVTQDLQYRRWRTPHVKTYTFGVLSL